jgi:hypothetical protein
LQAQVIAELFELEASGFALGGCVVAGAEGDGVESEGMLFLVLSQGEQCLEGELEWFHDLVTGAGEGAELDARA